MNAYTLMLEYDLAQVSQRLSIYNNPNNKPIKGGLLNGLYSFQNGDTLNLVLVCNNYTLPTYPASTVSQNAYVTSLKIVECTIVCMPKMHLIVDSPNYKGISGSYPGTPSLFSNTNAIIPCLSNAEVTLTNWMNGTIPYGSGGDQNPSQLKVVCDRGRWEFSIIVTVQYIYQAPDPAPLVATPNCFRVFRFDPEAASGNGT